MLPLQQRTVEIAPHAFLARALANTINVDDRTVNLTWTTGAQVLRADFWTGERWYEELSLKPDHVRLDRLNSGAPLLDTHSGFSLAHQLGVVEEDSVKIVGPKKATATVRFSKRADVEPFFQDVVDRIIRNASVGYKVFKYIEKPQKRDGLPVRVAVDWEPHEISMVPIGADAGAQTMRDGKGPHVDRNLCVIETRGEGAAPETRQEPAMAEDRQPSEFIAEQPVATPPPAAPPAEPHQEPNDHDRGTAAERARVNGIRLACRAARLPDKFVDDLINSGASLVECQTRVFTELNRRDPGVPRGTAAPAVQVGDDPLVHLRKGVENALLNRVAPQMFKLEDYGREYRGMTLLDIAKSYLNAQNIRTTSMSKMEIAGLGLGLNVRAGYHTTSDFALLLADVANKTLRQAYTEAAQTFQPFTRRVTLPDFKPAKRLQLGEAPALLKVLEHGEYKRGTIGEGKEQFQLATYGRVFAITRQALVNDDTDSFSRVTTLFGRAARNLESDLVWEQITSNPTMGDGVALFHASHGNLDATAGLIAVAELGVARAAMRLQKGLDGTTLLNITPRFLVVPPSLETLADQVVGVVVPGLVGSVNPFSQRLTVIAEPRLEANSTTAWYIFASPEQIDILELAMLEGEDGPVVESRIGFDVDGLEIKARHDVAAKVIDWRGIYKNTGLTIT